MRRCPLCSRSGWDVVSAILLVAIVLAVALLAGCRGDDVEPCPDAGPPVEVCGGCPDGYIPSTDATGYCMCVVPEPLQCTSCEYGWVCDVTTVGWRCWVTGEACEPAPGDPVCIPGGAP